MMENMRVHNNRILCTQFIIIYRPATKNLTLLRVCSTGDRIFLFIFFHYDRSRGTAA